MSNRPSLDDYVDVAERIQDFKDAHPDGSLQTLGWEVVTVEGYDFKAKAAVKRTFVVYRAAAFRAPDDRSPGHGIAWEPFPGGTPYTKDSELMNAETAAWGRAIVALGLVANRSLASRQEVRNRRADQEASAPVGVDDGTVNHSASAEHNAGAAVEVPEMVNTLTMAELAGAIKKSGKTDDEIAWCLLSVGIETLPANPTRDDLKQAISGMTVDQAVRFDALLTDDAVPGSGETS